MSSSESTLVKIPHCWILTSVDSDGGGGGGGGISYLLQSSMVPSVPL